MEQKPTPDGDVPAIPLGRKLVLGILSQALENQRKAREATERLPPFHCDNRDVWIESLDRLSAAMANVGVAIDIVIAEFEIEFAVESQGQNEEPKT